VLPRSGRQPIPRIDHLSSRAGLLELDGARRWFFERTTDEQRFARLRSRCQYQRQEWRVDRSDALNCVDGRSMNIAVGLFARA
jgi:hypothetical protein